VNYVSHVNIGGVAECGCGSFRFFSSLFFLLFFLWGSEICADNIADRLGLIEIIKVEWAAG
jgi:hypothetical protein